MADAMTGVNAELANSIRQGRMFGLQGISGTGSTMGGLASSEAGRQLQAALANQDADLRAQGMSEQSRQNMLGNQLASMQGQTSLFGTTPGMSNMFGNQALNAFQQRNQMEQARNQFGLGLLDAQMRGYQLDKATQGKPWWQQVLGAAGQMVPFVGGMFGGGGRNVGMPQTGYFP